MSVTRDNALAISPHYERDLMRWEPAAGNVAAQRLTGLVLSPIRAADPGMGAFGRGEGAFYSPDGGKTWAEDTGLPSLEVADMAASLRPDGTVGLYAALPKDVWWRRWDSVTWEQVDERPTRLLVLPPLIAPSSPAAMAGDDGPLSFSHDGLRHWQRVAVRFVVRHRRDRTQLLASLLARPVARPGG